MYGTLLQIAGWWDEKWNRQRITMFTKIVIVLFFFFTEFCPFVWSIIFLPIVNLHHVLFPLSLTSQWMSKHNWFLLPVFYTPILNQVFLLSNITRLSMDDTGHVNVFFFFCKHFLMSSWSFWRKRINIRLLIP